MTEVFVVKKCFLFEDMYHAATQRFKEFVLSPVEEKKKNTRKRKGSSAVRTRRPQGPIDKKRLPIHLTEIIDMDKLSWMLKNPHLMTESAMEHTKLRNYAQQIGPDGVHHVCYARLEHGYGRHMPQYGQRSLQGISTKIRSTLASLNYWDVDIVNSHPAILQQVCAKSGWPCPNLDLYLQDREAILESFPLSREHAKRLLLSQMYQGNVRSILNSLGMGHMYAQMPKFIHDFHRELALIATLVCRQFPCFREISSASGNVSASVMSHMLQHFEDWAIVSAVDHVVKHNWSVGAFIHDGFLLRKRDDAMPTDDLLEDMSAHVHQECGLNLVFVVKQFEDTY